MHMARFRAFALLVELRELAELAATLELLEPPEGPPPTFASSHASRIRRVGEPALRVFEELECAVSTERPEIADECFVARLGLADALRLLDSVTDATDGWEVLARANQTIGTLVKSAVNIEQKLCSNYELAPRLSRLGDVERAVALRNAYRTLLRQVDEGGEPADEELPGRLMRCRRALDSLLEQAIPTGMRVADRREAVLLRRRIDRWLSGEAGADEKAGRRALQDLRGYAELLLRINERQELVTHDLEVLGRSLAALEAHGEAAGGAAVLLGDLVRLYGCDADLDLLLEAGSDVPVAQLKELLRRIRDRLSPSEAPRSVCDLLSEFSEN